MINNVRIFVYEGYNLSIPLNDLDETDTNILEACVWMVNNNATIRMTAKEFGYSTTTMWRRIHFRCSALSPSLYEKVCGQMNKNMYYETKMIRQLGWCGIIRTSKYFKKDIEKAIESLDKVSKSVKNLDETNPLEKVLSDSISSDIKTFKDILLMISRETDGCIERLDKLKGDINEAKNK